LALTYKALSGDGNPSFATILKVTHALGFKLHVQGQGKGIKNNNYRMTAS
jgi:DNA-binding phage protein